MIKWLTIILLFLFVSNSVLSQKNKELILTTKLPEYLYHSIEGFGYGTCGNDKVGIVVKQKKKSITLYDHENKRVSLLRNYYKYDSLTTIKLSKTKKDITINLRNDSVFVLRDEFKNVEYNLSYIVEKCNPYDWENEEDLELMNVLTNISRVVNSDLNNETNSKVPQRTSNDILPIPFITKGEPLGITLDSLRKVIFNTTETITNIDLKPVKISSQISQLTTLRNENKPIEKKIIFDGSDPVHPYHEFCFEPTQSRNEIVWVNKDERCSIKVPFYTTYNSSDTLLYPVNEKFNYTLRDSLHYGVFTFEINKGKLLCINYSNSRMSGSIDKNNVEYSKGILNKLTKVYGKPKKYSGWYPNFEIIEYHFDNDKCKIVLVGRGQGLYKHQRKDPFRIINISYIDKDQENLIVNEYKEVLKNTGYKRLQLPWSWYLIKQ